MNEIVNATFEKVKDVIRLLVQVTLEKNAEFSKLE